MTSLPAVLLRSARGAGRLAVLAGAVAGAACSALPRAGPLSADLTAARPDDPLRGLVRPLDAATAILTARPDSRGFPESFERRPLIDPSLLGVGDVLDVVIWETGDDGLFAGRQGGERSIADFRIDGAGMLFVPFAGRVRAAGATVEELRERIRRALAELSLDPQVNVRVREPVSRTLTIQGTVARPGPYVLDHPALRLAPMIAFAGGSTLPPEQTEVTIRRGDEIGSVMLADLYADPALDIALAPGDIIILNAIRERFLVLGASNLQSEIPFPTRRVNLLRAIALARGLNDFDADPTGVFVFRREDDALADALLPAPEPEGVPPGPGRPVVYRLDMTAPEAFFVAQSFEMRDGDAIFVTNAPLTELRKILQLFTAVITPVRQGAAIAP